MLLGGIMTQPRMVVPGATYFISRRVTGRVHLFAPNDPRMKEAYLFALAVAAKKFGILVHTVVVPSDHEHLTVTDPEGVYPLFLQYFHRIVALATKALRKWDGPVWDHEKTSVVELRTPQSVVEKIGYAIANPVTAGLVRKSDEWPGVTTRVDELGTAVLRIERPSFFFDPKSDAWPDVAELALTLPPAAAELGTDAEFRELVRADVDERERAARADMAEKGRAFLGAERCAKLSPFARSTSPEPRRSLKPTFACGRGRTPERMAAIARLRAFRAEHRAALTAWREGDRGVLFPVGTWLMRLLHAANVVAVPLAAAA